MRLPCAWATWTLCLCAFLAVSARDDREEDETVLELIQEDGTQPETGSGPTAQFLRCNKAAWRMPGQYLVMLHRGSHESHVQRTIKRLMAKAARRGYLLEVLQTYSGTLHGFLVKMSSDVLHLAMRLPHVHYIEEDSSVFAQSAPWNLQRLMQPHGSSSENGTYRPPNDGAMAEVYLMDGSVQSSHREVEGRVFITDFNNVPEEDGVRVHRQASQCDSHGTHMAGVVSGSDSGVAPGAGVNLVRVLNCQGKGTVSGALAGLEFIRATLSSRPMDAVIILLPFIGGFSRSLNAACRDMVANGVTVIAAAGNYRDDACLYSPASEPEVITVGAVNLSDQLMSQGAGGTNFGRCVDLFAPGDDVVSASSDCITCFTSRSGTSQAAAHAAGVAAVILSANQKATPLQVLHTMLRYSISNTINLLSLPETQRLTTANLVAAMPPDNFTGGELLCRSVWSERSGVAKSDTAVTRCRQQEEMMGCSSYAPDGVGEGEAITVSGGQMECVAHNGPGRQGVYAVARCCVMEGLQCQVRPSSPPGRDARCENVRQHVSACLSRPSGSKPHSGPRPAERNRCQAKGHVTTQVVCCHGPSLECKVLDSGSAEKNMVEVSCETGWTLTSCRAVAGSFSKSFAEENSCRVFGGVGDDRVVAVAVCCRISPGKPPL
ncbi:proprotein convertase subtilisin/kexin type 9 [Synchiropus splendidus]|uniref:proprotein convertase subtilisin/kexin type 9 n=1 Tax=Synchiropus splendidus TaxID=270530 RepID=UPI00237E2B44|nr:proprotein convertase subtilisin/kexin type 9 [Synchiropus splendidus]